MWITADCVMMFSIFPSPKSTTGMLFILYFDKSKSIVKKEFDVCKAKNGAQRKDPEMSLTYTFRRFDEYEAKPHSPARSGEEIVFYLAKEIKPVCSCTIQRKLRIRKSFRGWLQQIPGLVPAVLKEISPHLLLQPEHSHRYDSSEMEVPTARQITSLRSHWNDKKTYAPSDNHLFWVYGFWKLNS